MPILHGQLGLPPTALTEDLAELHAVLVDCVDKKIAERKEQVEEWTAKCGTLENESLRLLKALGSHAKVVAGSVGELRKQQV
jgi:protein regulator of cytokinesis 1